jgi:hypothetical protein
MMAMTTPTMVLISLWSDVNNVISHPCPLTSWCTQDHVLDVIQGASVEQTLWCDIKQQSITHSRIISGSIQGFIKLSFLYVRSHIGILPTVYNQCLSPLELWVRTPFMYLIQHYVIKSVSDLQQVCDFLRFPPPIKLTATI